jgi:hypothetical protein
MSNYSYFGAFAYFNGLFPKKNADGTDVNAAKKTVVRASLLT